MSVSFGTVLLLVINISLGIGRKKTITKVPAKSSGFNCGVSTPKYLNQVLKIVLSPSLPFSCLTSNTFA